MGSVRWWWAAVAVPLCVMCGCRVGSSAGAAVANPIDNGAIPANSIAGTVTFKGSPLAGATVTLFMTNDNTLVETATSDANGNYSFSGVSATGDVADAQEF